jgi:Na+/glutamate symporter
MVDVIAPAAEPSPLIDIFLIICVFTFAIAALTSAVVERYIVLIVSMILCILFAFMFLVTKGWGKA